VIAAGRTAAAAGLLGLLSIVAGCGPRMDFGSNVLWVSLFEGGNFDEWTSVFASERLTGALLDRLTHHVHILEMNGDSYRLKHSKRRISDDQPLPGSA
jgi:hypothetical protein